MTLPFLRAEYDDRLRRTRAAMRRAELDVYVALGDPVLVTPTGAERVTALDRDLPVR